MSLILFILVSEGVGLLGSFFTQKSVGTWYSKLKKPSFNPPNWLFGPVWTVLYLLMAISAWLITKHGWMSPGDVKFALFLFCLQLIVNGAWSFIFFEARLIKYALADIILLAALVLLMIFVFYLISPLAGLLLVPYFAWVVFAAVLNYYIWKLNP
jgi:benzodiazapine receptor